MMTDQLELWHRDPTKCVQELIGNPALKADILYEPARCYTDENCTNQLIDETWTADWWWATQVNLAVRGMLNVN